MHPGTRETEAAAPLQFLKGGKGYYSAPFSIFGIEDKFVTVHPNFEKLSAESKKKLNNYTNNIKILGWERQKKVTTFE